MHHMILRGMVDYQTVGDGLYELRPLRISCLQEASFDILGMSVPNRTESWIDKFVLSIP